MPDALIGLAAALAAVGLAAGFLGGLFGIGGGVIVAPALFHVFGALGVPDDIRAHAAVATSLSTIIATSVRSISAHAKAGAVDDEVLRAWLPWVALGAGGGAFAAGYAASGVLLAVFGGGMILTAALIGLSSPAWRIARDLPRGAARVAIGSGFGALSALMGIGGGAFGATLMTLCGRPIHQAVATASGFGAAIAFPGALAYVAAGWGREGLPWGSLGFVNVPGFLAVAVFAALTAPWGASLAHRLDQRKLKRLFAALLAIMGCSFIAEALGG
jgi:uncharacterized membrane protein YfcA